MTLTASQERFLTGAAGNYYDPDGVYAFQCVDTAIAYAMACYPEVSWETTFGRGNAKDHYPKSNAYFDSIPNIVGDLNSYPQRGDIVIWGGDNWNPYGHIAVVLWADAYSMTVLQQNADGSGRLPTQKATVGYVIPGAGGVVGWLRPKVSGTTAPALPAPATGTLNGIDISMHQGSALNIRGTGAQFVGIKATEGGGYTDPEYVNNVGKARRDGLPILHYHFARPYADTGNTPQAEADWFLSVVRPYIGPDDILVLDFEAENTHRTDWANDWLDLVAAATEKRPWLYANQTVANQPGWDVVKAKYPLWCARYPLPVVQSWSPLNAPPSVPGWNLVMWQYSQSGRLPGYGGDLDLNVFYGDMAAWQTLAAGGRWVAILPPTTTAPPVAGTPTQCIVEPGDTLTAIAAQFGTTVDAIVAINPGLNADLIYPGQVLNLPGGGPLQQPGAVSQCIVDAGDTLAGIAEQFGVDLNALVALNGIANPNLIYPGQLLNLPTQTAKAAPAPSGVSQVIVDPGDTLGGIASQFGVNVNDLARVNGITNPDYIQAGQVLNLP
ncbi:endolysin [Arthrobacter phage KBurrousTX]|uniref:lysozyme n=1 Tax=Arthrobacter phage KBurrousTX TaxID=2315608 RepID=A0A386K8H2_9CAUD|nr:endolysin [Arthrobacter phage KBurrousTX]AYD81525.1 endolysin [Arthrobacter phage KBurrousTX]